MIVRAIEAIGKGVADPEAFAHVAKLSRRPTYLSRTLMSAIKLPPVGEER
jgi:hypothetical protein